MIEKKLFIETIEAIKKQSEIDRKCSDAFKIILPDDFVTGYNNHNLTEQLIKLLQTVCNDQYKWIDYFIFDLEFGSKYKDGMIKNADGSLIDLSNIEKLYTFIKKEYNETLQPAKPKKRG